MANGNDPKGTGLPPINKMGLPEASKDAEKFDDSVKGLEESLRSLGDAAKPVADAIKYYTERARKAAEEQLTWDKLLKQSKDDLRKWRDELFGAEASMRKMTGAVKDAGNKFLQLTSLTKAYEVQLDAIRKGQEDFGKSALVHSGMQGKASKAMQKSIDGVRESYETAREMMLDYHMDIKEAQKLALETKSRFEAQIQASGNYSKSLKQLQLTTLSVSKTMGVDAAKALDYMQDRMEKSNLTMEQVRQETLLVAKATDSYLKELNKIPGATKGAYISQQELLDRIRDVNKEFAFGAATDNKMWMQLHANIALMGKKMGMTKTETQSMQQGMTKFMSSLQAQDLSSYFGIKSAQDMMGMLDELEAKGDDALKKRIAGLRKSMEGAAEPDKIAMTLQALRGNTQFQLKVLDQFNQIQDKSVRMALIRERAGLAEDPLGAARLSDALGKEGELTKTMRESTETQTDKQTEANDWLKKSLDLYKERMTPEKLRDQAILGTYEAIEGIKDWLQRNFWLQIGVAAAKTLVQIAYLRKISANTSRMAAGGLQPGGDGPSLGGRRSRFGKGRFGRWAGRHRGKLGLGGAALMLGGGALLGRELTEDETMAVTGGSLGLSTGSAIAARMGGAAAPAATQAATGAAARAAQIAEMSKRAAMAQPTMWQRYAQLAAEPTKKASWASKAAGMGGKFAKYGGKALKVAGPLGMVASVGMAIPEAYQRFKKAESVGDYAKAGAHFLGDISGFKMGYQLGTWLDKKTGASKKIADAAFNLFYGQRKSISIRDVDKQKNIVDAWKTAKANMEAYQRGEVDMPIGEYWQTVAFVTKYADLAGSWERGAKESSAATMETMRGNIGGAAARIDTEKLLKIKNPTLRARAAMVEMMKDKSSFGWLKGQSKEGLAQMMSGVMPEDGSIASLVGSTLLRSQMEAAGLDPDEMLKAVSYGSQVRHLATGGGVAAKGDISAYEAKMKQTKAAGLPIDSFGIAQAVIDERQKQQQMNLNINGEGVAGQPATPQDGKYNPMNKSMTYTMPLNFSVNMETLGAAAFSAYQRPGTSGKTGGTKGA